MNDHAAKGEILIQARWVVPVAPRGQVIDNGAVVARDGRIIAVGEARTLRQRHPAARVIERPHHLLCPGFVNAHTHSPMTLLRGFADDLPLSAWLQQHIWPAEKRWVDENFVRDGTRLALCEMVRGGTTCFNDMYFHPDVTAAAVAEFGLRARLGILVLPFATGWAATPAEYLQRGLALRDTWRGHPRIGFSFAPHSPQMLDDDVLERVRKLVDQLDEPLHVHVQETRAEVQQSLADHGRRPLARLQHLGLVSSALAAVHMTQVDDQDLETLAAAGASVVHCPQSNLKLASGLCPVTELLKRDINVAIGTDGAASNNRLDMLAELRSAALLAKAVGASAASVDAAQALELATLGGARALGWADDIGSLTPGKWADMICIDLAHVATTPVYDPLSALVYAAGRDQVSDVWVAGRALVSAGALLSADEHAIVERATHWASQIGAERRPVTPSPAASADRGDA